MSTFEGLGLQENLLKAVTALGYTQPTPIQEKAIPVLRSELSPEFGGKEFTVVETLLPADALATEFSWSPWLQSWQNPAPTVVGPARYVQSCH